MYYFKFAETEYRVRFIHNMEKTGRVVRENGKPADFHGETIALVDRNTGDKDEKGKPVWVTMISARAWRSVKDPNYSRPVGRQKALVRVGDLLVGEERLGFKKEMFNAVYKR